MSWFSRSKEAPIVDLAVPSGRIPKQDPLRSDGTEIQYVKLSTLKSSSSTEELRTLLSEIKDLVLQKSDDPSTVDGFISDLRACAKGHIADTKNTVNTLLGQWNLTREDFTLLSNAIVSRLLHYQANYGWPAVQLAENRRKTASVSIRDRAPSRSAAQPKLAPVPLAFTQTFLQ
ncbi:hypothetical protein K438DRAFT_1754371 [Mycena galopus ATCC 62051]|nr:hypothetical protein K438DRAFT_1754371 [Mycena galopus ATCC 62051]